MRELNTAPEAEQAAAVLVKLQLKRHIEAMALSKEPSETLLMDCAWFILEKSKYMIEIQAFIVFLSRANHYGQLCLGRIASAWDEFSVKMIQATNQAQSEIRQEREMLESRAREWDNEEYQRLQRENPSMSKTEVMGLVAQLDNPYRKNKVKHG